MVINDVLDDAAQDEAHLRQWARDHFVPLADRSLSWPAFILDEMRRQDEELRRDAAQQSFAPPKLLLRVKRVAIDMNHEAKLTTAEE